MLPLPRGAVWQAVVFLLCAVLFVSEVRSEGRVVCYYTNWSVYRPGTAKFNPQNINPYLCTHLVYAFGGFTKDNQMKPFDKYQDIEQGGYAKFTGLKTYNKQLKTMIAIGGWNEASSRFSPLVASPERRQKFIKNILKFLRQNHFDGIDLDWEYPAHREGGKPRDRDNYAQFVQELRAEFERESEKTGRPRLLITMAVPAGIEYIEKGYDIPKLNKYLDWFNLLTYDFHSSHEPSVNHHAPLYSLEEESEYNYDSELNIDYSLKFYLKAGADRDKLVLGIPTYGRSFTLINEESTEIGSPSEGPGEQGDATREKGYLAYYEICQNIKDDPEWTVVQPNPNAMGPYAYRRNQWVGYDDEDIVRKKAQYVVEHGLGGIMFWAIDNDDFRGTCTGKPYPLIEAAKEAMLDGLGLGINEVSKPSAPKKPLRSRSRENSSSSSRNRINDSERKEFIRRPVSGTRKPTTTTTTTEAPKATIRLTEAEGSSLYIGGRTTTPPPPTTPDPGTDFKCEEEGFFQHPRDCKKYYWCLDSGPSGLGIVGHQFTCPSGLYFNPAADSCDFARNVPCKIKKSTTAAPVTTTSTTPRTTTASNRVTAATSRNSFLRTTTRRTTTTTTEAPEVEEAEYEEEEENEPTHFNKDRDPEEDPKVIKELIDLIRKVGGIEELEKHLLRKEDGSISLKEQNSFNSDVPSTPSTIAKTLYDKVLSRPNTYNSFRNRLTSSTLYKNTAQTKTADFDGRARAKYEEEDIQEEGGEKENKVGRTGYSKYSSVVRGNSRQGPQNEGLDKLPELEGFLKEKKQYVTINRNRGSAKTLHEGEENEEENDEEDRNAEVVDEAAEKDGKKLVGVTSTPAYSTIRRTKPTTEEPTILEDEVEGRNAELNIESNIKEKKTYATLNRSRGRFTTTELPATTVTDEIASTTNRYKYFERARPTKPTSSLRDANDEEKIDQDDATAQEDQDNILVQISAENDSATQKSQTTRLYASIGRRTTIAAPTEIPTTATIKTNSFETSLPDKTPEPILTTTTTSTTTPASTTTTTTNLPELIASQPTIKPITPITSTAYSAINDDDFSPLDDLTTISPTVSGLTENSLDYSPDLNSLSHETLPTTKSSQDNTNQDTGAHLADTSDLTTARTATKTSTSLETRTDTDGQESDDKVNNLSNNLLKTQYKKYTTTRTSNLATTTTTEVNENESSTVTTTVNEFKNSIKSSNDGISSNSILRGNNIKYSGGRRQSQPQITRSDIISNRKFQNRNQQTSTTTTPTTELPTSTPKDFLDTVSSPRPFGFPRRRTRPTLATTTSIPSTDEPSTAEEDESGLIKATPNTKKKYQFNRSRKTTTRLTATSSTTTVTPLDIITEDDHLPSIEQVNALHDASTVGTTTTESTLSSSPASTPRRVRVLKYRRPVGFTNTTLDSPSINATSSVTNNTDTTLNSTVASSSLFTHVGDSKLAETVTHSSETAQTKTETPEIPSDATQPSKRLRKVIRKLKRPLNKSDVNDEGHQSTTKASIESSTVSATTFGLKRPSSNGYEPRRLKLNQTRYSNQPERDSERQNIVSNIARGNARFSLPNGRFDTERITVPSRGPLFGNGNRRRFGSQGQVTSTEASNIKVGVESEEKDYIDHKDKKEEDKMEYTTEDLSVNKTEEAKLETSSETLASLSIDDSTTENAEVESTTERTDKALEVSEVSSAENIDESTTEQVEDAVNSNDKADGKNEGKIYNRANVSACSNNGKEGCKSNGENDVENDSKTDENKPGFKNDENIHDIEDDRHDHKSDDDNKKGLDKDDSESDPNVGVIQLEKSSESKKVSKETSQLQKIRNRIRNEHEKSTTDSDKISSRFKNILREKNNGTKDNAGKGKTTITNGSLDLQKIRSKVKSAQNKGSEDEGVINTRLRKLLLEKAVSTSTTTMHANEEEMNQIETTTSFELDTTAATPDFSPTQYLVPSSSQELVNETWADHELEKIQTTPFTDDLETTTPIAETSSENSLVNSSKNEVVEANNESATTQMVEENDTSSTAGYDVSTTTTPNPSTRRKFVPSSRSKKVTTFTETTTITTAAPIARPTLRRKLISKKPYLPSRSSLTLFTSTQRALSTTKSQKFFPRKFGNFQRNKGTANTGQTSIGTNGRNSRLPGISRFETRNSQRYGSTESYESIEDDYYDDDSEHEEGEEEFEENKPVAPAKKTVSRPSGLFNRQPIFSKSNEQISYEKNEGQDDRTDDGDGIEDEDEDEDSGDDDDDDGEEGDDDDDAEEDEDATTSETPASRDSSPSPLEVPPASRPAITQSKSGGNVPFNPKNRLPGIETNSSGIGTGRYANHLRIANRPKAISALTLKTVALDLETTTLPTVTRPAPFIPTYTPTYERKYIGPSTTDSSEITVDNSLEDLNIEAINARNKKIFDINSKKHTTLKPKILTPPTNSDLVEQQQPPLSLPPPQEQPQDRESPQEQPQEQLKEQALPQEQQEKQHIVAQQKVDFESQNTYPESRGNGFITTTVPTPTKPTDTDLTNSISNEISSQDRVELSGGQQVSTTQETPTTTLQHVFTLTDDDVQTNRPPTGSDKSTPPRQSADRIEPKHKVVEINRIVEVTSKEDKLRRKSKANQELSLKTVGSTSLRVESLPHIEQLGEISVVKYVHLVNGDDIVVDGHSTVADYTPTEDPIARSSLPIRNSVPEGGEHESTKLNVASTPTRPLTKLMTRYGKSVVPEVILEAVETSTIPLEGLFDSTRKGKELNPIENLVYDYISGESQVGMDERRTIDTVATLTSTDLVNSSRVAAPSSTNTLHTNITEVSSNPTSSKVAIASEHPATAAKPSTVAAALFPAYVRPIVPLLRPESNESSPLVISIANLDKVVLSKVMKTDSVPESAESIADSSAEYSSRHAAIIKPLTNRKMPASGEQENSGGSNAVELPGVVRTRLGSVGDVSPTGGAIQYDNNDNSNSDDNNHNFIENKSSDNNNNNTYNNGHGRAYNNISNINIEKVKSHSSVSAVSGSSVSEVVSFHSETHVVHKKRSRKHKSKKSRKSKKATTAFEASDATTTEASASNDVTTSKALAT